MKQIPTMTSRERMLAAINRQPIDHPPCSFMLFKGLWSSSASYLDFIQKQIDLGLDTYVQIPPREPGLVSDSYNLHGLPVHFPPSIVVREWKENIPDEKLPILIKEYLTPAGTLRAEVRQDDEWPYDDHVPFLDDYIESRSRKFIIENQEDLAALRHLLAAPTADDVEELQTTSAPILEFARKNNLLTAGGWGVGADLIGWVYGLQNMIFAAYDQPELLNGLLKIIHDWNQARMNVLLDVGIDLFIKRAWYENTDFWAPKLWRKFIFPILKSDVELAHNRNTHFGYLITANCEPLLEMIIEAGVDVIIGVDPANWNLSATKEKVRGNACLWGGVNGHLTIEQESVEDVHVEVQRAMQELGEEGGFILSPVDNVRELNLVSQRNTNALIHQWQQVTGQ